MYEGAAEIYIPAANESVVPDGRLNDSSAFPESNRINPDADKEGVLPLPPVWFYSMVFRLLQLANARFLMMAMESGRSMLNRFVLPSKALSPTAVTFSPPN